MKGKEKDMNYHMEKPSPRGLQMSFAVVLFIPLSWR